MSIKPIDYHLSFNRTIYESRDKQNDFNKIRDNNAFLQGDIKNETERKKTQVQETEHTEHKRIKDDNKNDEDKKQYKGNNRKGKKKANIKKLSDDNKIKHGMKKGNKLDVFI